MTYVEKAVTKYYTIYTTYFINIRTYLSIEFSKIFSSLLLLHFFPDQKILFRKFLLVNIPGQRNYFQNRGYTHILFYNQGLSLSVLVHCEYAMAQKDLRAAKQRSLLHQWLQ